MDKKTEHIFRIRDNKPIVNYVRENWRYFMHKNSPVEGVKIVIRKNNIYVHISKAYCVILNDLEYMYRKGILECNKNALKWLKYYTV